MNDSAFDHLISALFDEEATPEQEAQITESLSHDPDFRARCLLHLEMDAQLASLPSPEGRDLFIADTVEQAATLSNEHNNHFLNLIRRKEQNRQFRRRAILAAVGIAAVIILAVFLQPQLESPRQPAKQPVLASITLFENGSNPSSEAQISAPEVINLTSGRAKIQFSSGCIIALEAPATFSILDALTVEITKGRLNGWCPPSAHGFRVITPEASLIDLGTSFGVTLNENHEAEFVVFDGMVEIERGKQKTILENGQSLFFKEDQSLIKTPLQGTPYKQTWLLAEGILSTSGAVAPVDPDTPEGIAGQRDDFHVLVSPEKRHVSLNRPLQADLITPGTFVADHWNAKKSVTLSSSASTGSLSSYLLHARVERPITSKTDHVHYQGSVSFAEPVIAVIASQNFMKKCDDLFATGPWKQIELPINNRGLEGNLEAPADRVTLSPDRRTITIDIHTGYGIDELRVLTRSTSILATN
jgi:negative regulator of sigma E activity